MWPKASHLNVAKKKKKKCLLGRTSLVFPGSKKESWLLRTFEKSLISYPIFLSVALTVLEGVTDSWGRGCTVRFV